MKGSIFAKLLNKNAIKVQEEKRAAHHSFSQKELNDKLFDAIFYGEKIEAIEDLLDQGANPNAEFVNGTYKETALFAASSMKRTDIVKLLIEKGANVNIPESYNKLTPLHRACYMPNNSSLEIVKLLIENGADLSIKDGLDRTAFDVAKTCKTEYSQPIIAYLYEQITKDKENEQ